MLRPLFPKLPTPGDESRDNKPHKMVFKLLKNENSKIKDRQICKPRLPTLNHERKFQVSSCYSSTQATIKCDRGETGSRESWRVVPSMDLKKMPVCPYCVPFHIRS